MSLPRTSPLGLALTTLALTPLAWASDPIPDPSEVPAASAHVADEAPAGLLERAAEAGTFQTLATLLERAELVETLQGDGPFTVFAPTDEAFAAIPELLREELLLPGNAHVLAEILTYHVVAGEVSAAEALAAGHVRTLQHAELDFRIEDGRLRAGTAGVIANDVMARNGVLHVLDSVLLPPGVTLPEPEGRKVIGVFSEKPGRALASQLGIDRERCLLLTSVVDGDPAQQAGLQAYDVLTALNGRPATDATLKEEKQAVGFGGRIHVELLRAGQPLSLDVQVGIDRH